MSDENNKNSDENTEDTIKDVEEEVVEFEYNEDGPSYAEASEGEGREFEKAVKKLKAELKQVKKEKEEYLTGWQKERADFLNYKKGEDERRTMLTGSLRERILSEFLMVVDSFNMAFANREAWEKVDENWRRGVEYIYAQLNTVFENYGVKAVGVVGEPFDPNIHQPVEMTQTEDKNKDHTVSLVIQKGYKMGERIMRPARVNVYEYKNGN